MTERLLRNGNWITIEEGRLRMAPHNPEIVVGYMRKRSGTIRFLKYLHGGAYRAVDLETAWEILDQKGWDKDQVGGSWHVQVNGRRMRYDDFGRPLPEIMEFEKPKCECGATACGHLVHSNWCPMNKEED